MQLRSLGGDLLLRLLVDLALYVNLVLRLHARAARVDETPQKHHATQDDGVEANGQSRGNSSLRMM